MSLIRRHKKIVQPDSKNEFTLDEAKLIGEKLGIEWDVFSLGQFRKGMNEELEHGSQNSDTNVTDDDALLTGKIALAHLNEFPDYYDRLEEMQDDAEAYWKNKPRSFKLFRNN